ncbi:MAG: hypothetical protein IKD29_05140 [Lentisphaeria bacterium]|nr:hypothetical protein [Lentisphaeria bacterium]
MRSKTAHSSTSERAEGSEAEKAPFCAAKQLTAARPSEPKAARLSKKHPSEPKAARLKNKKEQQVHLQPENLLLFFFIPTKTS